MNSAAQSAPAETPRVGRYEVLKRIGKGGMASVYLSRVTGEAGFTRTYALKVLHPHLADDKASVEMLMDEAKIAARLTHPNVVSTVDLGLSDGRYYVAMEYVEGVALDRLLRKHLTERPPELIVTIALDALEGLAAAHELCDETGRPLELVHRDVTPGNVIVGLDGRALIADFGVAKARARLTKTMPGTVKGKAGYIAPEVALGRGVDWRADVFSMGVLLWNALTGEKLFDTDDLGRSITELIRKEVPPPSTVGLMPPPIFDQPILRALERDPADRFPSARDMSEALQDALIMAGAHPRRGPVGAWVEATFGDVLEERRRLSAPASDDPVDAAPIQEERSGRRDAETRPFRTPRQHESHEEEGIDGAATEISASPVDDPDAFARELEGGAVARTLVLPGMGEEPAAPARVAAPGTDEVTHDVVTDEDAAEDELAEGEGVSPIRAAFIGFLVGVILLGLGAIGYMGWTIYVDGATAPAWVGGS